MDRQQGIVLLLAVFAIIIIVVFFVMSWNLGQIRKLLEKINQKGGGIALIIGIIILFSCKKAAVVPSGPATPPSTSSPTTHKVKYVIYADPTKRINGSYIDSAGRTITFDNWKKQLDTITGIDPIVIDSNGYHSLSPANFQIKIGSVEVDKSAYIKASGSEYAGYYFCVAICKDSVINGETHFVVKKITYSYPVANDIELSYIVK